MKFHAISIDLGGGLDTPGIVIGLTLFALLLAVLMVRAWRSGRPLPRRLFVLVVLFLGGVVLSPALAQLLLVGAIRLVIALRSGDQPDGIGFITSTPRFIAPAAALVAAALFEAAVTLWRRLRASNQSGTQCQVSTRWSLEPQSADETNLMGISAGLVRTPR